MADSKENLIQNIQMVDLVGQYEAAKDEIDEAIQNVINSSRFINGPQVQLFADDLAKYTGSKFVIPCGNGTDALQIALMALNLNPGDEIIVPAFTYIATVEVIALLGFKPVFADVDPGTFNIDIAHVEHAISDRTKAIMVVHLFGQSSDMDEVSKLAETYNLKVIEDNAQAIGSNYFHSDGSVSKTGTIGDIGTTSFFPSKNLGCYGDGGAIFTQDEKLAKRIKMICNHGQSSKYYHDILGVNSRLDTMQAAILDVKLKRLDHYISKRQSVATFYDEELSGIKEIQIPQRFNKSSHVFHQYTLKVPNREDLRKFLTDNNIPSMVYYPLPMHLQKAYLHYGGKDGDFPVSEDLCKRVVSIPVHTEMSNEALRYITDKILQFFS